jgi:hypothetical protein
MNFRQTAILIGAVFAVVAVLLVLTWLADDKSPGADVLTEELAGVKPEDVDTVEMERDTGSRLKLVRTDAAKNKWELVEPYRVPADGAAVNAVVAALLRAKPTASGEVRPEPAAHGLEPPGLKVTLRQGSKASTVNLGEVSIGGSKALVFVTTSARPARPMAVPRGELEALFRDTKGSGKAADLVKWVADYRVKTVFPADGRAMGEDVAAVKFDLPGKKKELALSRTPAGGWKFDSPAGWGDADAEGDPSGSPTAFTGVGPLLRALTNLSAATAADFIEQPKDLKEYGLNPDNPDRVRVEMRTKDGQVAVVYLGKFEAGAAPPPPIPGMPPHPPTGGGKVYVSVEGQQGVIRANATNLSGLAAVVADPAPLRDRDLLRVERGKTVDGLDIILAGQAPDKPTKLRKVGNDWKLYGGPGDPQNAFGAPVMKIVDVVTARRTIKDFPAPNPANFAAIAATVYVWADGFNPPPPDPKAELGAAPKGEPVKKAEPTKLEFGRVEGETLYVRRTLPDGQVNEFALPTAVRVGGGTETVPVLATVAKTRLDLLDPSLPSFSDAAATRITVSGANNYVLVRDEKPDPATKETLWRFAEPAPQKGQVADSRRVSDLLTLLATSQGSFGKFVDEAPANPAEYTLAPPRLKVVVGLGDKSGNDIGFEFGKDTADPDKVYARVVGRPAVFTIQRRAMDQFASPDLRDRVVFRGIPAAQATSVELTGWGGIGLKFEKNKDGVWVSQPPTPPAFVVDPAKVTAFVDLLARTPVKTFEKGAPEPKHGFGDPKLSLTARVRWPGGEAYVNLGGTPDGGASYYGWTTALPAPDQIFTIDAAPFKPYKDGPGGFAR